MPIYLQHGNLIDYVPPTDTSTEDVVFMGGLVGIPQTFIPAGELGALSVDGVYMFTKKDGVSVNLGEVVKYCGTTKLAQDSNADLTLGVAVADAEADSLGVKVKINSVLPTDGGGGGGSGGEIAIDTSRGLSETSSGIGINIGLGLKFNCSGEVSIETGRGLVLDACACSGLAVKIGNGLSFGSNGELTATGAEVALCGESGLYFDGNRVAIKYCGNSAIKAEPNGGVYLAICGASGLSIQNGQLVASGGGGGGGLQNWANGDCSLSILGAATTSDYSTTIGVYANASGYGSTAVGYGAYASGLSSFAIGAFAKASGVDSTALGRDAQVHDDGVTTIGSYASLLRTQLYVIAEGSPLSQQYLNGKAGLAYAVWGDSEIYTNGKVKEGKIISFETLFANGVDFVPTTEEPSSCLCC